MKKLVFATLLFSGVLLGGCSGQESNKSTAETTSTTVKVEMVDREAAKEAAKKQKEESKKLVSLIPDTKIYFPGKKMSTIDDPTGDYWGFDMNGATLEEYNAFVKACQEDEWFTETIQGSDYFYAYTFDKEYYLTVSYNDFGDNKYVNIWVNKATKNDTKNTVENN